MFGFGASARVLELIADLGNTINSIRAELTAVKTDLVRLKADVLALKVEAEKLGIKIG